MTRGLMQIRIIKGTKQIGGAFTEITTSIPTYDGVLITHHHQDHCRQN